eukprot:5474480-Pyramimonas_sp.AAC.1
MRELTDLLGSYDAYYYILDMKTNNNQHMLRKYCSQSVGRMTVASVVQVLVVDGGWMESSRVSMLVRGVVMAAFVCPSMGGGGFWFSSRFDGHAM